MSVDREPSDYANRDRVLITSRTTDTEGLAVSGVTVNTVIDTPDGANFACIGQVTDAEGEVRCRHRINANRDGTGQYDVTATATQGDITVSYTTFFNVN